MARKWSHIISSTKCKRNYRQYDYETHGAKFSVVFHVPLGKDVVCVVWLYLLQYMDFSQHSVLT